MGSKKSNSELEESGLTEREREVAAIDEKRAQGWKAIEEHAESREMAPGQAAYWKFAAAKSFMGWGERQLISEAEFDAGIAKALNQTIR